MIKIEQPQIMVQDKTVRISSVIHMDGKLTELYFETSSEYQSVLDVESCDAFVLMLLPHAMILGEDIECIVPVSTELKYQLNHYLIPTLDRSTKRYHMMQVRSPKQQYASKPAHGVVTGYSGGADSLYTMLTHMNREDSYRLTHLFVCNAGCFEGDRSYELYSKSLIQAKKTAQKYHLQCVGVHTNITEIVKEMYLSVVSFRLIACAMVLHKLWNVYLLSSAYEVEKYSVDENNVAYYDLLLTSQCSTKQLTIYSSGSSKKRIEKLDAIGNTSSEYRNLLHVCIKNPVPGNQNCGLCTKCIRTELALIGLGMLNRFSEAFPLPVIEEHMEEIIAKAIDQKENSHMREDLELLNVPDSVNVERRLKGLQAAKIIIEKNRTYMENKAQEIT